MADDLKTEVTGDPLGRGYSTMTDQEVVNDLNTLHPAPDTRTRPRSSMTGRQVRAAVIEVEYNVLSDSKKAQFLALTASDDLDPFGLDASVVRNIFGGGSTTVSNLAAARVEDITRAQELGLGEVKSRHVGYARNS